MTFLSLGRIADMERLERAFSARTRGYRKEGGGMKPVHEIARKLLARCEETRLQEVVLNQHLGYPEDGDLGSLAVTVRWDQLKAVCDELETQRERAELLATFVSRGDGYLKQTFAAERVARHVLAEREERDVEGRMK